MTMKNEKCCNEKFKTLIGGQALIEGIYMRGPDKQAIVVRSKDGLVSKVEPLKLIKDRNPIFGWPLIRGVVGFGGSMINGVKALMYSADFFPDDEETNAEPSKFEQWLEKHFSSEKLEKFAIYSAVALGALFSVALFILLPTLLATPLFHVVDNKILINIIEGVIRIAIFLAYMVAVSKMKDMKRVFSYHGAEHKTIRCYEAGLPLTVENVRPMTRMHPRCGTSFLFVVMVISILVFSVVQVDSAILRLVLRLVLLPVVVAISYEINRFVGRHDTWFTRAITAPGMWLQNFTTNEPDDSMIEVGIESLKLVIPEREGADRW
ncbi:MAG: DUF1385 domain-containing protein [Oscillospiraceae bacterium]|nr:DUF1385 domain-containing protein [Oscillospiraceae bacterium]